MDVQLLGPLQLVVEGRAATPSARKPRQLLSLLLLEANRTVSVGHLTRGLWDDTPPRSAHTTLQTYIVQLRRHLARCLDSDMTSAKEIVTTTDGGYMFALREGRFDLREYRRLAREGAAALNEGDPARASTILHSALACWQGRALADVRPSRLLQGEVQRLEDSRLRTQEQCIDADLRLGRHREVLDDLSMLCAEHRLNENLHLGYMVALYRCGLRVEALKAFRTFRDNIVDALGLEPANSLRRLHETILRTDQDLVEIEPGCQLGIDRRLLAVPGLQTPQPRGRAS